MRFAALAMPAHMGFSEKAEGFKAQGRADIG
jgi:hypothetical protein